MAIFFDSAHLNKY